MNNYDSSLPGVEYVRIPRIVIEYPSPLTARVTATEARSVKMQDGSIRMFPGETVLAWDIHSADMPHLFPLVNPTTGAPLGASMTYQQLMLGLLGATREKQSERDTPPVVVPDPDPEPV